MLMPSEKMEAVVYTRDGDSWEFIGEASFTNGPPGPMSPLHLNDQWWTVTDCLQKGTFPKDGLRIRVLVKPK